MSMRVTRFYRRCVLLLALPLAVQGLGCVASDSGGNDGQGLADAALPDAADAAPQADAAPDAGPNPNIVELPPMGDTEDSLPSIWGHIVAYSDARAGEDPCSGRDRLAPCRESRASPCPRRAASAARRPGKRRIPPATANPLGLPHRAAQRKSAP